MGTLGRKMEQNTKTVGLVLYSVYRQMPHAAEFFCVRMWVHHRYFVTKRTHVLVHKSWSVQRIVLQRKQISKNRKQLHINCHNQLAVQILQLIFHLLSLLTTTDSYLQCISHAWTLNEIWQFQTDFTFHTLTVTTCSLSAFNLKVLNLNVKFQMP